MSLMKLPPALVLVSAAVAALAGALVAEYGFGLKPCELCLAQRVPYVAVLVLAGLALGLPLPANRRALLLALCALALAIDGGIAVYHVGVEQHWWTGPSACTSGGPQAGSAGQLKALLAGPVAMPVQCDAVPWSLFGVSMAGYNIAYAWACAAFAAWAAGWTRRRG
jgi:disulfide bond formation protein DsbB